MDAASGVMINAAMTRQAIALEMVKMSADMQKQVVSLLEQAVANVPVSGRGQAVNISA